LRLGEEKEEEEDRRTKKPQAKTQWPALLHRAAISRRDHSFRI